LPKIGEGFREWSEASSYGKKRLEMLRWLQAKPATGFGGIPHRAKPWKIRISGEALKRVQGEGPA